MIYDVQKASLLKRFSAALLDIILLCVLATGFAFLLAWIMGVDGYTDTLNECREIYKKKYGWEKDYLDIYGTETYELLTDEQKQQYVDALNEMFIEHPEAWKAYNMSITLPLLIVTFGLLLSCLVMEFIIPLCLKNGQTVGKKVFGLGVVFNNSVRLTNFALFVRAIFGKYTIETMFPLLLLFFIRQLGIMALILVVALFILQLVLLIATKNNCLIHDILANTVVVDLQSQMVFDTTQELIAYKEEQSKVASEKESY